MPEKADLPTRLEASFDAMDAGDKNRLQAIGAALMALGAVPVVAGVFYDLSALYLIFTGLVMVVGVCLSWPRLGVYVLTSAPGAIAKLIPHEGFREMLKPERRKEPRRDDGEA